ncbi:MAG: tRNA (N6-threonylcarbamoyladenosine(37)-N6)-methyltransferase TrmO [Melioribacteraceae bacterium]|nr:tRNA (N6-threonylcarbamoyladenosine(37)-N6)-methyltransferase TrmO [Melioribacteraceae bacterium]
MKNKNNHEFSFTPIGYVKSDFKHRYETPRQGVLAGDSVSYIQLEEGNNFQQAIKELEGFDRIWVIYVFHLNNNWKTMVNPPRHLDKKVGVFASRSPHRPNPVGISCVKLEKISGLKIYISESDILDGSPVLDIKPYLPYSDSFPDSSTGWVRTDIGEKYSVEFLPAAAEACDWLEKNAEIKLMNFARLQLEFKPSDNSRKRVSNLGNDFELAYRTWRINYTVDEIGKKVVVKNIRSGYTLEELSSPEDKYEDKTLHKKFNKLS